MYNRQNPSWKPIINLPMILDIQPIIKIFTEQQEFVPIFSKQLSKWQREEILTMYIKRK